MLKIVRKTFRNDLTSVIIPILILFVALTITSSGFLSAYNITSLLQTITIYMLVGMAQMTALSLGQFNLAVGSIGALTSIMMGFLMQELNFPLIAAIPIGLMISALCGFIQGFLIAKSGISPFIITLALLSIFIGIATVVSHGEAISKIPEGLKLFNRAKISVIPVTFLVSLFVFGIIFVLFKYTKIGLNLQAVGANARAAKISGINVSSIVIFGHIISGLLCGIASVMQTARFGAALISVGGDWMLTSFVVAVLGGTLLSGGKASPLGTFLGSILMVLINNALVLWGISTYMFPAILGLVLLGAYEVDRGRLSIIKRQSNIDAGLLQRRKK